MFTALPDQLKWEYSAFPVQISQKQRLSPGFMRITVTGEKLRFFGQWGLDQRIKVIIPSPAGNIPDFGILEEPTPPPTTWLPRAKSFPADQRPILRTYTPSAVRPELCEVDIDIYLHNPSGPVSRWAKECNVDDELIITGPDVRAGETGYGITYHPTSAIDRLCLIGDCASAPAIANIVNQSEVPTTVFLHVDSLEDDVLIADSSTKLTFEDIDAYKAKVFQWASANAADPSVHFWIAGETSVVSTIRKELINTYDVDSSRITFLGYWKTGRRTVD